MQYEVGERALLDSKGTDVSTPRMWAEQTEAHCVVV